jgi:hypothetical protein
VVEAFREDGKRLQALRNKRLQAIHATVPKRQRVELGVHCVLPAAALDIAHVIRYTRHPH